VAVIAFGSVASKEGHVVLLVTMVLILGGIRVAGVAGMVAVSVVLGLLRVRVDEDVNVVCSVSAGLFVMFFSWGEFLFVVELGVGVITIPVRVVSA
jgi:hypothetical protein